jgi:hypothetical protein
MYANGNTHYIYVYYVIGIGSFTAVKYSLGIIRQIDDRGGEMVELRQGRGNFNDNYR